MFVFAAALTASAVLQAAAPAAAVPAKVGACAWAKIPAADQTTVLEAYHRDRGEGLVTLMNMEVQVATALDACAPKTRVPPVFLHRALWAEMTQQGAAHELAAAGVDQARLNAAWANAPAAARACLRNRLGPHFGLSTPDCTEPAETEIADTLKLSGDDAQMQAAIFYLAKAEGELAESVIVDSPFK